MAKKYNPAYQKGKSRAGTPGKVSIAWYDYHDNDYAYTDRQTPHFLDFKKIGNQALVDDSRDWKTKYHTDRGFVHNLRHGLNMSKDGRYFTGHSRTPWVDDDGDMRPKSYNWAGKQWEVLDFDAYNRDALYKSALQKRHGKTKFKTPQDILDAEAVMSGSWKPAPPPKPKPKPKPKEEIFKDVLGNPVNPNPGFDIDLGKWAPQIPTGKLKEKLNFDPAAEAKKQVTYRELDLGRWAPQIPSPPTTQQQIGYEDFAGWMNRYNTANPVAPPPPPKDTFGDFMGYMKQYNMMSGPQQQAPQFGYGVGGTASGGVQAANPYQNFANYMQQFQTPSDEPSVTSSLLNI